MKLTKGVIATALSAALLATPSLAVTIKAGATCTKVGLTQKVGTSTYLCSQVGNKKVWVKKTVPPIPTVSPKPSETPLPTAIPSSSPSASPTPSASSSPTPTPTPTPTVTPSASPTPAPIPSPSASSLPIYVGGAGAVPGSKIKKSAELNFTPDPTWAGNNLKLWVYDPENPTRSLNSPGIYFKKAGGDWTWIPRNADGAIYGSWDVGTYVFDTIEPNGNTTKYQRKTYSVTVGQDKKVSIAGLLPNSINFFTVTINLNDSTKPSDFVPKNVCQLVGQDGNSAMNSGFPHRSERLKTSGEIKALIIPVDFPDVFGVGNPADVYFAMANGTDKFYQQMSGGKVNFSFEILKDYLRLPFLSTAYGLGSWNGGDSIGYWKAALEAADPYVDYSKFDVVYVLSPRNILWSSIAYGPAFPIKIETDDGYVYNGTFSGADAWQNISGASWKWMAHETGHLFGLHDLYTVNPQPGTFGFWDLMAMNWSTEAIEFSSWNRYISGWLEESEINCLDSTSIASSAITQSLIPLVSTKTGTRAQFIKLSASKILAIEYRITGGLDLIPKVNEGVLVYTVDMTIQSIKGGWSTQRRTGSTREDFTDAALKSGDSISVNGITISVASMSPSGADIRIAKA